MILVIHMLKDPRIVPDNKNGTLTSETEFEHVCFMLV